ncbi:MAG: chlorite dismutase family protein [Microthrixaceae bacterium]|nr:chlorite dismutase family protein [Microthrixaceae bacterium]HPB45330.1 chlorite dismutase family protein [Microthrixaceae bacterium]
MEPSTPSVGLCVSHLFWMSSPLADADAALEAIATLEAGDDQVVTVSMLGHKSDLCTLVLSRDLWRIRAFQTAMAAAGFDLVDSYQSVTETSEYATHVPEEAKQARLYPQLPIVGKDVFCFYPMSKRRNVGANWYALDYDERMRLMMEHGKSGRSFAGRVTQLITGSTGLDDYEWGVTLFCVHVDDVKEIVYTMRYDEASAQYGEFGTFYIGTVASPAEVLDSLGVG